VIIREHREELSIHWNNDGGIASVVKKFNKQCGDCPACYDRRLGIKRAGIVDKTEYLYEMSVNYPTYYTHENEERDRN